MNNQNNFNSYNSNSTSNNSSRPVKNRFFNPGMLEDTNMNDVGTSTSNLVNNQVISWGVGGGNQVPNESNMVSSADFVNSVNGMNNQQSNMNSNANVNSNYSQELLNGVNSVVYTEQPEILDSEFMGGPSNNIGNNDNTIFGYTNNTNTQEVLDVGNVTNVNNMNMLPNNMNNSNGVNNVNPNFNNMNNMGNVGAVAPVFNQNASVDGYNNNPMIDNNLAEQQPLSMTSLGVSQADMSQIPDVADESKYFPANNVNVNNNINNNPMPVQPVAPIVEMLEGENVIIDETALVKAYLGGKYQNVYMSSFSLGAFLFGSLTFFLRKMYLSGLILFVFQCGILYYFRDVPYILLAILVVLAVITALIINPLYMFKARHQAKVVKKKFPKVSQGELNRLIAKRGASNMMVALILQIALLGGAGFLAVQLLGTGYFKDLYNKAMSGINTILNHNKTKVTVYKGEVKYNDLDIENYFSIQLSDDFVREKEDLFKYRFVTSGEGENNACELTFGGVSEFSSAKDLIQKMMDYYEIDDEMDTADIKNLEWYYFVLEEESGKTYYRATDIDGKVVMFEYKIGVNTPNSVCDTQFVNILDSLEVK